MASPDAGEGLAQPRGGARRRILDTAYELFANDGIRAVGIDRIIAEANIAKATLYRHFASKEELVLAFLDLREQRWTHEWLQGETERRAATPRERLLVTFDVLGEWFQRPDFEGCSFINTLLEISDRDNAIHRAAVGHLAEIGAILEGYAGEAGALDQRAMAGQSQILMMGAIVSAGRGDAEAAARARALTELLLESAR
jgi:AcrR family transcriptional regulator